MYTTSVYDIPRYQIIYVFCIFDQVISATMQDEILQLSENHVFSYKINR